VASKDAVLATSLSLQLVGQLVGQSFLQLCLGPGDAQLNFTGDCALQLESPVLIGAYEAPPFRAYELEGVGRPRCSVRPPVGSGHGPNPGSA
jgi:hypothetical protein